MAQYVAIPATYTAHPPLQPLPQPAKVDDATCKGGCYSNDQVQAIIDALTDTTGRCFDQLDSIRSLSAKQTEPKP